MSQKKPKRQKKHLTTIPHSTDVALFFERRNMPFRFFALSLWQLTSFCSFPWRCNHRLENPKAKGIVRFQIYFLKNVRKEIPLKQVNILLLSSLRHVREVEVTSVCVRCNIEMVGLTWISRNGFSPSFIL